jgi:capsular exopolysaccharide synthesis family protein
MGKISDALERHHKEKSITLETLSAVQPERSTSHNSEIHRAQEFCTLHDCSPKVVALSQPDSVDAENFRKTFVAVNLAASLAMGIDEYVLLLDCDMRNSRIHEMFGYTNSEGLSELLTGKEHLRDLILRTPLEKLSILPAGIAPPNPAELLSSTMMEDLLKDLKARYQNRFIIIDSTPAKGTAEASILANYVDGVILVIMAHKTPRKAIEDTIKSLGRDKILGIVFNGHTQAYKHYQKYYKKY